DVMGDEARAIAERACPGALEQPVTTDGEVAATAQILVGGAGVAADAEDEEIVSPIAEAIDELRVEGALGQAWRRHLREAAVAVVGEQDGSADGGAAARDDKVRQRVAVEVAKVARIARLQMRAEQLPREDAGAVVQEDLVALGAGGRAVG